MITNEMIRGAVEESIEQLSKMTGLDRYQVIFLSDTSPDENIYICEAPNGVRIHYLERTRQYWATDKPGTLYDTKEQAIAACTKG